VRAHALTRAVRVLLELAVPLAVVISRGTCPPRGRTELQHTLRRWRHRSSAASPARPDTDAWRSPVRRRVPGLEPVLVGMPPFCPARSLAAAGERRIASTANTITVTRGGGGRSVERPVHIWLHGHSLARRAGEGAARAWEGGSARGRIGLGRRLFTAVPAQIGRTNSCAASMSVRNW